MGHVHQLSDQDSGCPSEVVDRARSAGVPVVLSWNPKVRRRRVHERKTKSNVRQARADGKHSGALGCEIEFTDAGREAAKNERWGFWRGIVKTQILRGFLWGAVATVAMTIVHIMIWAITGRLTVMALATKTLPGVMIAKVFGPGLPTSIHLLLSVVIHLGYGGFWGGVLFALTPRVTLWKGVAMGAFLYLGLEVFLFPLLGRGVFASAVPDRTFALFFSMATHFTYGATLGWLGGRKRLAPATAR